jgi:hypothetical protein
MWHYIDLIDRLQLACMCRRAEWEALRCLRVGRHSGGRIGASPLPKLCSKATTLLSEKKKTTPGSMALQIDAIARIASLDHC